MDEDGYLHSQEAISSHPERIDTDELKAELRAQIEHFRAFGREPDHLDCYDFVHLYPSSFAVYVELAEEYGLPVRFPFPPEEELDEAAASVTVAEIYPREHLVDQRKYGSTMLCFYYLLSKGASGDII